jgi:iron complex transport system substrate-binding protein
MRVISLIPSLTEDLCAIGAAKQVVGVSAYSNDVPCAEGVPVVGDFASIDAEKIVALHPDVVVAIPAQARSADALTRLGIRVVLLSDISYDDLFSDIRALGTLTGREAVAQALIVRLHARTAQLRDETRAFVRRPRVFVALGSGPIFTAGANSYIGTLIDLAGGRNAAGNLAGGYATYGAEELLRLQPDAIVTDPSVDLQAVMQREPWRNLRAVSLGRVWVLQDAALLERPGPRYNEGLEWLVKNLKKIAT